MEFNFSGFRNALNLNSNGGGSNDLGFGDKLNNKGQRLINRDGSYNVTRSGRSAWTPYQDLVEMNWSTFILIVLLFYIAVNAVFAIGFVLIGVETLSGIKTINFIEDFANAFFFSVQTFTTVGYGSISPIGTSANLLASLDALVGLMALALATGLFFARFAKPKALIAFSDFAIIAPYQNGLSLQFRIANRRDNKVINLKAYVNLTWMEKSEDGQPIRRFAPLSLERSEVFLFPLNWTIVHPINEDSPISGKSYKQIIAMEAEILVLLEGYDETYAQVIYSNGSYLSKGLKCGVKFAPMYYYDDEKNTTILELDKISEVIAPDKG